MVSLLIGGSGAAFSAQAADPQFCADYAGNAVHQFEVANAHPRRCMSQIRDWGRWSADYQHHYNWCLNVSREQAWGERNARRSMLDGCARDYGYYGY